MSEKTGKQLEERLLYTPKSVAQAAPELTQKAYDFCEEYKTFLNRAKTEREATACAEEMLKAAGYAPFERGKKYPTGSKVYAINRGKNVLAATIGSRPLDEGFHLNIAHIDSPRLDLKPIPLYEDGDLALLKTHYYGGIRKYQWPTVPLALHGVLYTAEGKKVEWCIGEEEDDPVFCVCDLLPHLGQEQGERKLRDGIRGEELNILVGNTPLEEEGVKEKFKLYTMKLLNEKYGLVEEDFVRAEIEAVPAGKARDLGFDRSMIGAYGHDDRVDAYPALMAEIHTQNPAFTSICILADKEEIGSEGVTGLQSDFAFHFIRRLCDGQGADYIAALRAGKCLSADVTSAFDPTFATCYEKQNSTYLGRGIAIAKYTGARGKSGTNDASAELVAYLTALLKKNGVVWQTGELGRVDLGGGGTVAMLVANRDIDTIDIGVPVLSMHAPFEVVSKNDVYMAYLAFYGFNNAEQ